MSGPDWRNLVLLEGILLEPVRDDNRMVFWLPTERDRQFQYWERVGTVPRGDQSRAGNLHLTGNFGACPPAVGRELAG